MHTRCRLAADWMLTLFLAYAVFWILIAFLSQSQGIFSVADQSRFWSALEKLKTVGGSVLVVWQLMAVSGGIGVSASIAAWFSGILDGMPPALVIVSVLGISLSAAIVTFLFFVVWAWCRAKGTRAIRVVFNGDIADANRGKRYLVRVINDAKTALSGVRVRIEKIVAEQPDHQGQAINVLHENLTIRDGEPQAPEEGRRAKDTFSLEPSDSRLVLVASIYRKGNVFVLVSSGRWKSGKWERIGAELSVGGFYRVTLRAIADSGFYGEATFRFGCTTGGSQNIPIFETVAESV